MTQNRPLSDYDPDKLPFDQKRALLKEATKAGCVYQLMVEGYDKPGEEGTLYYATNDLDAKKDGYKLAGYFSDCMTGLPCVEAALISPDYVPHPFVIIHYGTGRVLWKYTPPTPDDIVNGNYYSAIKNTGLAWAYDEPVLGMEIGMD